MQARLTGELLTKLLLLEPGKEVRLKKEKLLKEEVVQAEEVASNVVKRVICLENVPIIKTNLDQKVASNVERKAICPENVQTLKACLGREDALNVAMKVIEQLIALEKLLNNSPKVKSSLEEEEEDASNVEMKDIEQKIAQEKLLKMIKMIDEEISENPKILIWLLSWILEMVLLTRSQFTMQI